MNETQVPLTFPFVYQASDYHEFVSLKSILRDLTGNERIEFTEVPQQEEGKYAEVMFYGKGHPYLALFYLREETPSRGSDNDQP